MNTPIPREFSTHPGTGTAATGAPQRIGVLAVNNPGYIEAVFSCFESGASVVPLRSAEDLDRIRSAGVSRIITPASGGPWLRRRFSNPSRDELALIAFTSGTTGQPKGVMATHRNLADPVRRLNSTMHVDDSIREYVGAAPYFAFGFGRCRAVSAAGGSFYLPANGFNPAEVGAMLKRGEINAISTVPSLWRVLLQNRDLIGSYGRRVRWIEVGSQYMSRAEKEALKALFPQARIVTMYGLTEASRVTFLEVHAVEGEALESVGKPVGEIQVRVESHGRIAIRGPSVAAKYLIDGQERDLTDAEGWYTTNDLGSIRDGYLYYEGRADDVINCGGIKIDPEALESRVCAQLGCDGAGLAICSKPDAVRGESFLVAVTRDAKLDQARVRQAAIQATQSLGINAPDAIALVEVPAFPRTDTGKVQRKKLAAAYARSAQPAAESAPAETLVARKNLQELFRSILKHDEVSLEDSFVSLGGDSLSYVQLSMALERHLGHLPPKWERMTIAELQRSSSRRASRPNIESGLLLRALAIVSIVTHHAELAPLLSGGVVLLLLISGANLARFQADALMQGQWVRPVFSLLKHLLIPYWLISVAYQVWKQDLQIPVLLLFGNFVSPDLPEIFPTWFVNVLVQIILLCAVPFASKRVRDFARASPWRFGAWLTAIGFAIDLLVAQVWNADHLFNRVPHALFWVFALGWMIQFAAGRTQKLVTTAWIALGIPLLALTGLVHIDVRWVVPGALLLLWAPEVCVPSALKKPLQQIGAAGYYIYLTHMIFVDLILRRAHIPEAWIAMLAGVLGGMLVWLAVQQYQPAALRRWTGVSAQ